MFGFYDHHARDGVGVAGDLVAWRRVSRGSYKPFLHHVTKGRPVPTRPVKLTVTRRLPRTLDAGRVAAILAACEHLRDRFDLAPVRRTRCPGNSGKLKSELTVAPEIDRWTETKSVALLRSEGR